jgi:hypothetical protein
MSEITMSTTEIVEHIKKGAKLYRGFGDEIELRLAEGVAFLPLSIFDSLIDQGQIVPEKGGFYRAADPGVAFFDAMGWKLSTVDFDQWLKDAIAKLGSDARVGRLVGFEPANKHPSGWGYIVPEHASRIERTITPIPTARN